MNAAPGDFADTVLMPGDPLRAAYIAETYFDDPRRVTDVRNMWGLPRRQIAGRHYWHGRVH
jgi:purine-nucleoside phosphorylase